MKDHHQSNENSPRTSLPARGAWIERIIVSTFFRFGLSLPARGAWIESPASIGDTSLSTGRSPQGGRGLKDALCLFRGRDLSRRSPQGGRGLKVHSSTYFSSNSRRSPQGGRGLKDHKRDIRPLGFESLPARGAWIERRPPSHITFRIDTQTADRFTS